MFTWSCGPDMPFGASWRVHAVVLEGNVYVGGGKILDWPTRENGYKVMKYDVAKKKWSMLPRYIARSFTMVIVNNHLVLVGGKESGRITDKVTDKLGVWEADEKKWTHPYPKMPTARSRCSAFVYGNSEWLITVGGNAFREEKQDLMRIEILNFSTLEWCEGPRAPVPLEDMQTAVVQGTCYFMGGFSEGENMDT